MRRARWLAPWKDSLDKPALYHCISRVVDRRFVLGNEEREQFRKFMRMQENFSGCRILSYCLMSNHFHLLLEVPPMSEGGISDEELLKRLSAIQSTAFVAGVASELHLARQAGNDLAAAAIHARHTYRMHSLSEFMKTLLQRFTRWFNRTHDRSGTLWEQRYKSLIVESGLAARTVAAYIDLNPVRAGLVKDPADYRWSSYGEAMGGGNKGNGKKAREGLVRACLSHRGIGFEAEKWQDAAKIYRQLMGLALQRRSGKSDRTAAKQAHEAEVKGAAPSSRQDSGTELPELGLAGMLRCRVRYFTDGAVIGSKAFVNEAFRASRERFSAKRQDGARKMKGSASPANALLWTARDLRVRVS